MKVDTVVTSIKLNITTAFKTPNEFRFNGG